MNFWFDRFTTGRLRTIADVRRGAAAFVEPQVFLDLEGTGEDKVVARMEQIRAIRPRIPHTAAAAESSAAAASSAGRRTGRATGGRLEGTVGLGAPDCFSMCAKSSSC